MVKCTYCRKDMEPGTGTLYASSRGDVMYFCSRKCEQNSLKLKRAPRKVKWISKKQEGKK